ncbi:S8 family serine peptidase [Pontibacter pamirensis]|uniref:S8 family serine peptidase n=1 Tax=Pontibacter pamirensis TaxID=2562824 RepID=UPI00138A5B3C|nr:S8 family serine peptidase [Pontibacter pamirensis]
MLLTCTLRKSLSCFALAAILGITTGCQKEELMVNQFASPVATDNLTQGQPIEGQYIIVFKNNDTVASKSKAGELSAVRTSALKIRQKLYDASGIEPADVSQVYEGVIKGFAARLTEDQLAAIRKRPEIAYVEQDRYVLLSKASKAIFTKFGNPKNSGNGKNRPTAPEEPTPTPAEPAPVEPEPTVPAPSEPTPAAPTTPKESAPAAPAYTTITPLVGEEVPWNIELVGYGDGTGKTVWVIDSGIDTDHPDLNVDLNRSLSLIYKNPSVEDGYGHGTSVAGIIAARNNGSGIIGVAANATIVALRVFDDAGAGTLSRAINAVNHVGNNGKPGDVVNLSLGSGMSTTLDNAVKTAAAKGILFAIAAGNSAVDCYESSPARVDAPGVYTVSAMDSYRRLWDRSNYGAAVDFAAPGVNVTVTTKGGGIGGGAFGTSMAAPHVAGVLLLRGTVYAQGTITGDKDNTPDPIASVN